MVKLTDLILALLGVWPGFILAGIMVLYPEQRKIAVFIIVLSSIIFLGSVIFLYKKRKNNYRRRKLSMPLFFMIVSGLVFVVSAAFFINPKVNPVIWNFEGFLGCNWSEGVQAHVGRFQVNGINRSGTFIRFKDIHIISLITGESIPVTINTNISGDNPYVKPSEHAPIPDGVTIYTQALFYDQKNPKSKYDREGMPEDIFMKKFRKFNLIIKYNNGKIKTYTFNTKAIEAQIDRVKPHY
jgi:hypothetical protein